MWTFEVQDGGATFVARLEAPERTVLLDVIDDVLGLLGGYEDDPRTVAPAPAAPLHREPDPLDGLVIAQGPVHTPGDPALLRLLPDASRVDPEVTAEFRRLTEADLRSTKVANLLRLRAVVADARPEAVVLASEASGVAAALTDVRLVLAERLEVRTDEDADQVMELATRDDVLDTEDREAMVARFLATVYVMLTVLQESLVGLMVSALPHPPERRRRRDRG
ncbi:MAG TPA: DUF2017 family protein [Actinotalea sp.]